MPGCLETKLMLNIAQQAAPSYQGGLVFHAKFMFPVIFLMQLPFLQRNQLNQLNQWYYFNKISFLTDVNFSVLNS